ncbi:MAG: hypothetical protein BroJett005_24660 [Ignavibacteriota bacterium]|nr:MAG: hypothetical protein BroJett005_24660 [Ignavibacteriota bacterium]
MEIIKLLNDRLSKNEITFSEQFFLSKDKKTIMGEVPFSEILFLDYRDTEAGSNPREFIGINKTNIKILKSLLSDPTRLFRFLHSGIIVSLLGANIVDNSIKYDDSCLTNGNQTRFIILAIVFLSIFFDKKELSTLKQNEINSFVKKHFADNPKSARIFTHLRYNKINQVVNSLLKDRKYTNLFKSLDLKTFLSSKIRLQLNLIDNILEDLEQDADTYSVGTLIAEANNDTQKVKADDIFGNKYKAELESKIFKKFLNQYSDKIEIEYRFGEVVDKKDKVHILTLLRPVVATGILTKDKDIFEYTNQRDPIYKIFEKILQKTKNQNLINVISLLVPFLFDIRENFVKPTLEKHRRELIRKYKEKAAYDDLSNTIINEEILKYRNNNQKLEKIIKTNINYNIEHILPVLVFQIRNLICMDEKNNSLKLNINEAKKEEFLKSLTEVIYENYVEKKLKGLPTSLTTVVRSQEFYEMGIGGYKMSIRTKENNAKETDFILKNRVVI